MSPSPLSVTSAILLDEFLTKPCEFVNNSLNIFPVDSFHYISWLCLTTFAYSHSRGIGHFFTLLYFLYFLVDFILQSPYLILWKLDEVFRFGIGLLFDYNYTFDSFLYFMTFFLSFGFGTAVVCICRYYR